MTINPIRRPSPLGGVAEGAHVAVLYQDAAEQQAALLPYLADAVRRGEGAVCVTATDADLMCRQVGVAAERVEVIPTDRSYLRDGRFDASYMAGWLAEMIAAAPAGSGEPRRCVAGVLDWFDFLDDDGFDDLFRYESTLSALAPAGRHSLACFYDLRVLPAAQVIDVFRTHPKVVVSGTLWESPFYVPEQLRPLPLTPRPGFGTGAP